VGQNQGPGVPPPAARRLVPRRATDSDRSDPGRQPAAADGPAAIPTGVAYSAPHVVGGAAATRQRKSPAELGPPLRRLPALLRAGAALRPIDQHALPRMSDGVRDRLVRLPLAGVRPPVT